MIQATLRIFGKVQGVLFRSSAQKQALNLGLNGWVKNLKDGTVSVCIQGPKANVLKFIDWAEDGPESAEVEELEVKIEEVTEKMKSFIIKK